MRILVVEDNLSLQEMIVRALEGQGFLVDACDEGDDGLRLMLGKTHDLVLLDRMLPRMDGLTLLRRAREEGVQTPVLMMTALGEMPQVVEGLDGGADDYIVKPFALEVLLARVRALVRRPRGIEGPGTVAWGAVSLELGKKELCCNGKCSSLSTRETSLLELFLRNPETTLTRSSIFGYVWGSDAPVEEANLDNYIHFVRQRLREIGASIQITTVRGVGYRLENA